MDNKAATQTIPYGSSEAWVQQLLDERSTMEDTYNKLIAAVPYSEDDNTTPYLFPELTIQNIVNLILDARIALSIVWDI